VTNFDELILVWDGPEAPKITAPWMWDYQGKMQVYDHRDMDACPDSWIWSRGSSACRSFGFMMAVHHGADIIFTCDDDVELQPGWVEKHMENLSKIHSVPMWAETLEGTPTRGYPYLGTTQSMETVLSHGLWSNVADWDAMQQLAKGRGTGGLAPNTKYKQMALYGCYFPMCGMNLAFKKKIAPLMYFGLQGRGQPFDRFDDIWCGVILQRIARRFNWICWTGDPIVIHKRASNAMKNLEKEVPGIQMHEHFWQWIQEVRLSGRTPYECFDEIADVIEKKGPLDYWGKLAAAMRLYMAKTR